MAEGGYKCFSLEESGPVCVAMIGESRLVDDAMIRRVGEELIRLIDEGKRRLLIDMQGVEYLASGMLGKLITILRRIEQNQGRLGICSVGPDVQDVFRISKLDTYFKVYSDRDSAVKAMSAG